MLSHANAEFVENADGSISMIPSDPNIQPVLTNYPVFVRTLKEIGYEGYINYEFCHMDDQIRLAQLYFRDLIENA